MPTLTDKQKQFETWLRASGIYCSTVTDADTEALGIFVDFDDCPKSKEKLVASQAKKLGLRIEIADKGAAFF